MKKFICGLLVGFMLAIGVTTYAIPEIKEAAFSDIKLVVNGKQVDSEVVSVVTTDKPGYMTNYVPARALAESLGASVTWDGKAKAINVSTETDATSSVTTTTSGNVQLPSVVEVRGIKAVNGLEMKNALKAKGYDLVNAVNRNYMQIVKDDKIVVKDIAFIISDSKGYFLYDFYEANILPLLQ